MSWIGTLREDISSGGSQVIEVLWVWACDSVPCDGARCTRDLRGRRERWVSFFATPQLVGSDSNDWTPVAVPRSLLQIRTCVFGFHGMTRRSDAGCEQDLVPAAGALPLRLNGSVQCWAHTADRGGLLFAAESSGAVPRTSAGSLKERVGEPVRKEGRCAHGLRNENSLTWFFALDGEQWHRERRETAFACDEGTGLEWSVQIQA
jgi:hypothetical protein